MLKATEDLKLQQMIRAQERHQILLRRFPVLPEEWDNLGYGMSLKIVVHLQHNDSLK